MNTLIGGRYRIVRELGRGPRGTVYQGIDNATGRAVAAKIMPATSEDNLDARLRFQQEGAVLSTLKHPNIVEVYRTFLEEDFSCIIMELLQGQSLSQILRSEQLSLPRVGKIAEQTAAALAYAHGRAIVHRDVKPDNIMIVGDDHVKVTDFGVAGILRTGAMLNAAIGMSIETVLYMAPEQIEGQRVDGRADIYSLGAVLYQMVTGQPPFEGDDPLTIAFKHVHKQPRAPRELSADIPDDWQAVILKCLAKDPSERFQTASALHEAISALGETGESPDVVATPLERKVDTIDMIIDPELSGVKPEPTTNEAIAALSVLPPDSPHAHILDQDVQFTVYRPNVIQPDRWYTVLAFAHKTESWIDASGERVDPVETVQLQAREVLGAAVDRYRVTGTDSSAAIPRGAELRFVPEVEGVEFNPPSRSFFWLEPVHREEFRLRAAARLNGLQARGRLSVFFGAILLGEVSLNLRVDATAAADDRPEERVAQSARPYRKIFASYSHRDLAIVEQVGMLVRVLGDEFVRDWTHLRSGEQWSDRLMDMIREADIFQLFWSGNSMTSPFVRREWAYALSLGRDHFIRPVYWEDPFPTRPDENLPPPELLNLHFQKLAFDTEPVQSSPPPMPASTHARQMPSGPADRAPGGAAVYSPEPIAYQEPAGAAEPVGGTSMEKPTTREYAEIAEMHAALPQKRGGLPLLPMLAGLAVLIILVLLVALLLLR